MRTTERTDYGFRLYTARKHARLSQAQLADAVDTTQSNIAELEKSGQGSAKTLQLAGATGVRPEWLAKGEGEMLDGSTIPAAADTVASEKVAHHLVGKPASADYRTVALSLAEALEESGTQVTVPQFIKLLEATFQKLQG